MDKRGGNFGYRNNNRRKSAKKTDAMQLENNNIASKLLYKIAIQAEKTAPETPEPFKKPDKRLRPENKDLVRQIRSLREFHGWKKRHIIKYFGITDNFYINAAYYKTCAGLEYAPTKEDGEEIASSVDKGSL